MIMKQIQKILVPTDFSKNSETAYIVAAKLAHLFGAKVDFLHVVPSLVYFKESIKKLGIPLDMDEEFYPQIQKESKHRLKEAFVDYVAEENQGEVHVAIHPRVSEGISEYASKHSFDLIVIGERGMGENPLFRGSTSDKVIRSSKVPVMSVNESFELSGIKSILVPTDGSEHSLSALEAAFDLAVATGANLHLFHVLELYGSAVDEVPRDLHTSEEEAVRGSIIQKLEEHFPYGSRIRLHDQNGEMKLEENGKSVGLNLEITRGVSAHYEIERKATDAADLVVIATHGHSGLSHLLLGSTAEKVTQHVNKPVLTIRPAKV
jgi:nucleotide-binding universal stress UspA family protein